MKRNSIGMAWFTVENFAQLRSMFEDADSFQATYSDWLDAAKASYAKQLQYGLPVTKVYLDTVEFPNWCAARGFRLDAEARVTYANAIANQFSSNTAL